ncbi:GDA1/CD39 nucleoside phosphatase family protein [Perilla frutescens var. frutescens]|nr:GDA1/CD39 nucleoside phosphatase family protein [Perilla frutescens var. frutescens]
MRRLNARTVNPSSEEESKDMDPSKLQFRAGRPGFRPPTNKQPNPRSKCCLYTSLSIAILLFCYILLFGNTVKGNKKYGVVIDGGSTGTRIHVFNYDVRNGNLVLDFSEKGRASMRVNPGLSAYAEDPQGVSAAVGQLVEFAKRNVPRERWGDTEIRLMATAGMRLLDKEDQEKIFNACRRTLRASGFMFRDDWASVISGSDEGLFAWVVANYALGTLGAEPTQTTGIIELGGASAQVTFVSNEPMPPEFSRKVKFGNFTYNLYSHSLLHFGQNVASDLLKESLLLGGQELATESLHREKRMDPCTPRGYDLEKEDGKLSPTTLIEKKRYISTLFPNGNFSECRSASLKLLQKGQDKCSYSTCYIGSTFIPKLQGKFLATENFFHTSKFFRLRQKSFLSGLVTAGEQFCGEDWSKLTKKYNSLVEEDLIRYCFSSAYIVALLHDSLGIAFDDPRIEYASQVDSIPLDWALGAFILQSAAELDVKNSDWLTPVIGGESSPLPFLFGIFLVVVLISWFVLRWGKPQLKTIYDLEKDSRLLAKKLMHSLDFWFPSKPPLGRALFKNRDIGGIWHTGIGVIVWLVIEQVGSR